MVPYADKCTDMVLEADKQCRRKLRRLEAHKGKRKEEEGEREVKRRKENCHRWTKYEKYEGNENPSFSTTNTGRADPRREERASREGPVVEEAVGRKKHQHGVFPQYQAWKR